MLRVRAVFLVVLVFAVAIAYRIFHIQVIDGQYWQAKSGAFSKQPLKATRGNIYACDGSLLATSLPYYRLGFDPSVSNDPKHPELAKIFEEGVDSLSLLLSRKFKTYPASYYKNLLLDARSQNKKFIYLSRGFSLTYRDQQEMLKWPVFREGKNKGGVIFEKIYRRMRPFQELGFRTVGYIAEDNSGAGLEASFNQMLGGMDGQATYQKLPGGIYRPIFDGTEIRPINGNDIVTTLDINIQDVAEASLLNSLRQFDAKYGCVVVMEVATGHIKAMANLGYAGETDDLGNKVYVEKYNYAVGRKHYPGSTFKLASYAALLEDGRIRISDTINTGNGQLKVGNQWIKEAKGHSYGRLSIKDAFAKSSNVAVAKLTLSAFRHRPQKYLQYITDFGLAEPLHFQILGEEKPFFRSPADKRHWNDAALAKMSYGYEAEISPLQTLAFYNAVANQGKMVQPIIVKEIRDHNKVVKKFEAQVIREKICSERTIKALHEMLRGVIEHPHGTGHKIRSDLYGIGGKTGTAHKFENQRWLDNVYYTSFVGFFPLEKPKYSAIVIVDSPTKGLMAGDAAAPVFKDIADKIYANDVEMHQVLAQKENAPDLPSIGSGRFEDLHQICNRLNITNLDDTSKGEWVSARPTGKAIHWASKKTEEGQVPDLSGLSLRDAIYLIENFGYRIRTNGRGKVTSQYPKPNTYLSKGSTITVTLG